LLDITVTDTIPKDHKSAKVNTISIANLFASSIDAVLNNESISKHFLR
jgi:phosphoribosylpyrophosphate synthetase